MTGSSGGQRPAETHPPEADPAVPTEARARGGTEPSTEPPAPGRAEPQAADVPTPAADVPAPDVPVPDDAGPPAGAVPGPAPAQRAAVQPAAGYEPAPLGPFGGASPMVGSPWVSAPGTVPGPSGIEATTGAPLTMLPQRAPRVTVPADFAGWDGPTTSMPTARPGSDPSVDEDDGEDFWLPIEEVHWDGTPVAPTPRTWYGRPKKPAAEAALPRPPRPPKPQRDPVLGLAGVILFSLLASFFAWVSAEPLWLAVGHGDVGTATVASCTGRGLGQHCRGEFTAADGLFKARDIRLVGVEGGGRKVGAEVAARMISADSQKAYVGAGTGPLHLRWSLGLGVILLCSTGVGWATGALRLSERRYRRPAALISLAGPLLLTVGFLAAAY
ncbi:hypothetical protein ACFP2T_02535 [Plantactinospora solaniradicis]|uniref:Uncharacterized protein n=1 Tax=Plantactinospora solaniradicis TaxID=1723736 RepID=A0ABW1K025_9ACTN